MKGEIVAVQNDQHTLVKDYMELHVIHTNKKRSLIPIVGKGLSCLFGTVTESDLHTICSNVSRLAKSQEEIAHVVDENISVINITRVEMSENRHTLNKIIWSLVKVDVRFGNITQELEEEVFHIGQFVQLYLQLDSIIQAIRRTVWQANSYVEDVQLQLNMLLLGHFQHQSLSQDA